MKSKYCLNPGFSLLRIAFFVFLFLTGASSYLDVNASTTGFSQFRGSVVDSQTKEELPFATISVEGTNIATVCNSDGEFLIKIPDEHLHRNLVVSYIGYGRKIIPISELQPSNNRFQLDLTSVNLLEVSVFPSDPNLLMELVMGRREANYMHVPVEKTSFYRETIRRGRAYVSLTEAVLDIYKHAYTTPREDVVRLLIGRKSTDYSRLDTLVFKLQGGPYSNIMLNIMKDPYLLFGNDMLEFYEFQISNITRVDDRLVYIINFAQRPWVQEPLFYGRLYVDTESLAVTSAAFNMNLDDKEAAARVFIRRKPSGANVYPTEASYLVNFREHDGRWYFSYSRGQVAFRVNWLRRLFHSNFSATMELAVTDWKPADEVPYRGSDRLRMNVIMEEAVAGFSNDDFWGDYNVIEPEQSIETVIRRIQRQLKR